MTRKIAFCGIASALAVTVMFFSLMIQTLTATSVGFAVYMVHFCLETNGIKYAALSYVAIALISAMLLMSMPFMVAAFAIFGIYPVLRYFLRNVKQEKLRWFAKFLLFNALLAIAYFAATSLITFKESLWILCAMMELVFVTFDIALDRVTGFLLRRLQIRRY